MARVLALVVLAAVLIPALALIDDGQGAAQEPLPTPRGQLGGREDPPPGDDLAPLPPLRPGEPTPPPFPPRPRQPTAAATSGAGTPVSPQEATGVVAVVAVRGGEETAGAGWVWDASGIVVTAADLVAGADRVDVAAGDGRRRPATVTAVDDAVGVAVLRTTGFPGPAFPRDQVVAAAGDALVAVGRHPGSGTAVRVAAVVIGPERAASGGIPLLRVGVRDADSVWPSWLAGAPVATEHGLVGMALPAATTGPPATPAAATREGDRPAGGVVVPVALVAEVVARLDRADP